MTDRPRRFLGAPDAAKDASFKEHFVESVYVSRLEKHESDIVFGSKGSGKTALSRALTELNQDFYFNTKKLSLKQISFTQVYEALSGLQKTSKTELASLARNAWQNVLAMYCLEAVYQTIAGENPQLELRLENLFEEENFGDTNSNNRLIAQIENIFRRIAKVGLEDSQAFPAGGPLTGLTASQREQLQQFPSNPNVSDLLEECSEIVRRSEKCVLISLDGFDSIVDHTPQSRRAIFAGLIDAIHTLAAEKHFENAFLFKAFLPQELTASAVATIWDSDKYIGNTHYLRWSKSDFRALLQRRLQPYSKTKSSEFATVWNEFMPKYVINEEHGLEEDSFEYVLRHTLYRPRQLLSHLQRIFDWWDETPSNSIRVDPSFIPGVVAGMNVELSKSVVNQLKFAHPEIEVFLHSWNGNSNVMPVGVFKESLRKIFNLSSTTDTDDLFDELFGAGVFGIAQRSQVDEVSKKNFFKFGFVRHMHSTKIHAAFSDGDLLALSPMFHEYCGCQKSPFGAIVPVGVQGISS